MDRNEREYPRPIEGGNAEETAIYVHVCRECGLALPYRAPQEQTLLTIFVSHLAVMHGAVL